MRMIQVFTRNHLRLWARAGSDTAGCHWFKDRTHQPYGGHQDLQEKGLGKREGEYFGRVTVCWRELWDQMPQGSGLILPHTEKSGQATASLAEIRLIFSLGDL